MKIDSQELQQLAAAAPRMDLYAGIHKALRHMMVDTLAEVGRIDVDDAQDLHCGTQRVLDLLAMCASHLQHENDFVHAAIEARAPGASAAVGHDHASHVADIERLSTLTRSLRAAAPGPRAAAALRLYRELSRFVAHNFEHMLVEETAHNAVLWAHYTDAELMALHDALVASIPPQEMMVIARWMIPAMSPAERAMVLGDMRTKAPAPAFDAILAVVQPHLDATGWTKLARCLDLAPAPGLVAR
jgi:hypothetical protein